MIRRPHLLRDVVFLTLPVLAIVLYILASAAHSFWTAEIVNYHGYPTRNLRVANFGRMLQHSLSPALHEVPSDFLSDPDAPHGSLPRIDIRAEGHHLDALLADIPGTAKEWVPGSLYWNGRLQDVDVRHRGQRLGNFYWRHKSWKVKTARDELVEGQRELNYTPIRGRLHNHLSNVVARRLGLITPRSRLVHVFVNRRDQGIYLQEEQVGESLIRRAGHMPGDVFYGDVFIPDEPKRGTDELFCNPFLWEKKARFNKYPDEYRPHLTAFLDTLADPSLDSWDRLGRVANRDQLVRYVALLTFQGDQHVDKSHNHKLLYNPIGGNLEPIPWNVRMNMPRGQGVESLANRLVTKVARDPRFLDDVHRVIAEELLRGDDHATAEMLAEVEAMRTAAEPHALSIPELYRELDQMRETAMARGETVRAHHAIAEVRFVPEAGDGLTRLRTYALGVASHALHSITLSEDVPDSLEVFLDRDADGVIGPRDLAVTWTRTGRRLTFDTPVLLATGRDFSAPYHRVSEEGKNAFRAHRLFTRLAWLESDLLLRSDGESPVVRKLDVQRTVGVGDVTVQRGAPNGLLATETIHPWRFPDPPDAITTQLAGDVDLTETLVIGPRDTLEIAPGTTLRLGRGVSVVVRSKLTVQNLRVERLDPSAPWGVFALQGPGASGSLLEECSFEGGSLDTIDFVDYTGMVSIYEADDVTLRGGRYAANVLGDDTIRYARCDGVAILGVQVEQANGDAIDCDLSTGRIEGCHIVRPFNDGIDLMTARVNLIDNEVIGAGDKGVSLGEDAHPMLRGLTLVDCVTGVAIKDGSAPRIEECVFRGCETGVAGYTKNWRYPGGGGGSLVRCVLEENRVDIRLDEESHLTLDGTPVPANLDLPTDDWTEWLEVVEPATVDGGAS